MVNPQILLAAILVWVPGSVLALRDQGSYLSGNPQYTLVDSALDSIHFTVEKTLKRDPHGHLVSVSSFVDRKERPWAGMTSVI